MSIGNLKDTGNQGNNLPFQWKVLQGLQSVVNALSAVGTGGSRNANVVRATNAWINADNVYSFSVANVGIANGVVMGETIKPGEIVNFDAGAINNYFGSGNITANGSGTELLITYITA